jgi:hypothetical protein
VIRAKLEGEAGALYDCCATLQDCLGFRGYGYKQVRLDIYTWIGNFQRYADELQHSLDAETDELQAAHNSGVVAIYRQAVQEWAEILGSV